MTAFTAGHRLLPVASHARILRALSAMLGAVTLLACGCSSRDLETDYGRHRQRGESGSVNGTDVLAGMFSDAGHSIYFRSRIITSEMEAADTIVWFPNDHAPPREEVCLWFDEWLAGEPGRTLVYVGRDFNAAPLYYEFLANHRRKTRKQTPKQQGTKQPEQPTKEKRDSLGLGHLTTDELDTDELDTDELDTDELDTDELDTDERETDEDVTADPDVPEECEWFGYQSAMLRHVEQLGGPWARGIDAAKADVWLGTWMKPDGEYQRLLTTGDDLLVTRLTWPYWDGSQLLLVANGSFLLNMPLVNHENRRLAGLLIGATGTSGRVVFLESGRGGPAIDPPHVASSLWTLFRAWPLGVILLQLAAVGVIFCFARWPIFGRPKQPPPEVTADFSKHVAAVGKLLSRTRDRAFLTEFMSGDESRAAAPSPTSTPGRTAGPGLESPPPDTKGS